MEDEPVMCFQHCEKGTNILCLEMPQLCPICSADLFATPLLIPPFRLPSPFVHSKEVPYSVVIKPTHGSFLDQGYSNADNLHVGLTDSRGVVYDFNEKGLNRSLEGWLQCLAVAVLSPEDMREKTMWDIRLAEFSTYSDWIPNKYNQESNNCFDFAMAFLKLMEFSSKHPTINDRSSFCKAMIEPVTLRGSKYITLYRQGKSVAD